MAKRSNCCPRNHGRLVVPGSRPRRVHRRGRLVSVAIFTRNRIAESHRIARTTSLPVGSKISYGFTVVASDERSPAIHRSVAPFGIATWELRKIRPSAFAQPISAPETRAGGFVFYHDQRFVFRS